MLYTGRNIHGSQSSGVGRIDDSGLNAASGVIPPPDVAPGEAPAEAFLRWAADHAEQLGNAPPFTAPKAASPTPWLHDGGIPSLLTMLHPDPSAANSKKSRRSKSNQGFDNGSRGAPQAREAGESESAPGGNATPEESFAKTLSFRGVAVSMDAYQGENEDGDRAEALPGTRDDDDGGPNDSMFKSREAESKFESESRSESKSESKSESESESESECESNPSGQNVFQQKTHERNGWELARSTRTYNTYTHTHTHTLPGRWVASPGKPR